MRKFTVHYSDTTFSARAERFETKPYDGKAAKEVAEMLEVMGCFDIALIPYNEQRQAA